MKKQIGFICLLFIFSIQGFAQWKPLTVQGGQRHGQAVAIETNRAENKTRIMHTGSGRKEVLENLVQDCRLVNNFLCLKIVNVLDEEKTKVIFRVYRMPAYQFLREIQLSRKTYDYTEVEYGEVFSPDITYPNGKGLFFVLHEDCEWTPVGKKAYLYTGENLEREKRIPLTDRKLALWINDSMTKLTTVTATKRVFKRSLTTGETIWELGPDNFTCNWFNYAPQLLLNQYLCIEGIKDRGSMFAYYFIDMNTGKIVDTLFSDKRIDRMTLVNHCETLSGKSAQE